METVRSFLMLPRKHSCSPLLFLMLAVTIPFTSAVYAQGDFQKAVSLYKQKQYAGAATEFSKLVEEDPLYETGYRVLGDCYLKLKRYTDASDAFEKAVELDPDNFVSAQGLAMARYNLQDHDGTVSALSRAEALAKSPPQKYQLHHIRGSAYYKKGDFQEAVSELSKASDIQRGNYTDILQLGISYFRLNNLEDARRYLEQAVSIRPDSREANDFLGRISFRHGNTALREKDYPQAARSFSSSVKSNPEDSEAWFNLGLAYLFSDNLMKAEESFRKSSDLQPDKWQPYDRLGYIFETTERYELSLENYQKALQINNNIKLKESVDRIRERIRRRDAE
ncbi:MAG: tetratricopeptide repeat protein [Acidobacteriota bacterium]